MDYSCRDLSWKYRWTKVQSPQCDIASSEIWPHLPFCLIYCRFPTGSLQWHHPDLECSCLWTFAKAVFLCLGGVSCLSGTLSEESPPHPHLLLPHLNSLALLFSFERVLCAPKLSSPHARLCAPWGQGLDSYSWIWHIADPQIPLGKWMDNEWMNMSTWVVKFFRDHISHSQYFAKSWAFLKTEI